MLIVSLYWVNYSYSGCIEVLGVQRRFPVEFGVSGVQDPLHRMRLVGPIKFDCAVSQNGRVSTPKWPCILPGQHFVDFRIFYEVIFLGVPDEK